MPLTIKQEVLQMVEALEDEETLSFLKAEIEHINRAGNVDPIDLLQPNDRNELLTLIDEPDDKDTVTHEEYLKATARWRTK